MSDNRDKMRKALEGAVAIHLRLKPPVFPNKDTCTDWCKTTAADIARKFKLPGGFSQDSVRKELRRQVLKHLEEIGLGKDLDPANSEEHLPRRLDHTLRT